MNNTVIIALGTNIGEKKENLMVALDELKQLGEITKKSSIYESEPDGYKDQDSFLNMTIELKTTNTPIELLAGIQEIEHKMGRIRNIVNGPRIIDLDIIFYDNKIINEEHLKIPHPRYNKRDFLLKPLKEIIGNYKCPTNGINISEITLINNLKVTKYNG